MKFDILNEGGDIAGKLGLTWTAYAMGDDGNVWPIASAIADSDSTEAQLTALHILQGKILLEYPNALIREMTITGESLALPTTSKSPVKQWIISKMKQP